MMIQLPALERPEAVSQAVAVLEARERDLAEAEQTVREAKVGLDAARAEDRAAYAAARDRDEPDPGPKHLDRARLELEDRERQRDGERLRVEQAQARLDAALAQHIDDWRAAVETALARADVAALKTVDRLEQAEQTRRQLRGAHAWLKRSSSAPKIGGPIASPLKRNANGDRFSLDELIKGAREAIGSSTIAAERERAAEREAAELEAERMREQRREMAERAVLR
jgi:hypothetical protein